MAALATLSTTTFRTKVEVSDTQVDLTSTTGIVPGTRIFADRELMAVLRFTGVGNVVVVRRGDDGTAAARHAINATVYLGRSDQFFERDPVGLPPTEVLVTPYINVRTGTVWVAQGDPSGPQVNARLWAPVTVAMTTDTLGARHTTTTTPS